MKKLFRHTCLFQTATLPVDIRSGHMLSAGEEWEPPLGSAEDTEKIPQLQRAYPHEFGIDGK